MLLKALVAFLMLPFLFAWLVPVVIAHFDPWRVSGHGLGVVLVSIGLILLIWCIRDFYLAGRGTLAPWEPPKHLVIVGLYRFTRNPMYIGVLLIVGGMAMLFGSPLLRIYLIILALGFHLRVLISEETWLAKQFGEEWLEYKKNVPRWLPRSSGWKKNTS